eukprot:CAMPEP_0168334694 /NCGR_PEP_ID=MMETSP0213-20121227/10438_1 /TAXON_ID=151035 /ORGANISM="Euplotes harpa, Strain FSP1.4" /LENGTH=154 /DNA_ID=CAMNT_0008339423 /DNA_START=232 /DNA_END=696 /DNA_ORIENTATION=-
MCEQFFKRRGDVGVSQRGGLIIQQPVLFRELSCNAFLDFPSASLRFIKFVANEHDGNIWVGLSFDVVDPLLSVVKTLLLSDVEDHECADCSSVVRAGDGKVPLLPGRVPDLRLHVGSSLQVQVLRRELDSDGRSLVFGEDTFDVAGDQAGLAHA